jgi:hypothetical protein
VLAATPDALQLSVKINSPMEEKIMRKKMFDDQAIVSKAVELATCYGAHFSGMSSEARKAWRKGAYEALRYGRMRSMPPESFTLQEIHEAEEFIAGLATGTSFRQIRLAD